MIVAVAWRVACFALGLEAGVALMAVVLLAVDA
jgi:hypothetical protein